MSSANTLSGFDFLQLPGPTNVPNSVLRAMHRPAEDFTDADFTRMARGAIDGLRPVFGTRGEVFTYVANGHGIWEAVLANLFDEGDVALIPETGRFSEGWREMAEDLGIKTAKISGDWRSAIDPQKIEEALRADSERRVKAVLATHIETSTGVVSDLAAIRAAMDASGHPALLVVDAVASLAVSPINMDDNRIDCVISAGQKGLMLPPGLAFTAINEKAAKAAADCERKRRYWDWGKRRGDQSYLWFYGTPPVQQMYGLVEALRLLNEEGLDKVYARHRRLAGAVRAAVDAWSQSKRVWFNCLKAEERSDAVTSIRFDPSIDIEALRTHCRKNYNVAFAGGLGDLFGKIMRIGHLGYLNEAMIIGVLGALELAAHDHRIDLGSDGVGAAVASLKTT